MPKIEWSADMGPEWDLKRWARAKKRVRTNFPSQWYVKIVLLPHGSDLRDGNGDSCHASTTPKPNSWLIEVVRDNDMSRSIRDLWHEWAHVLEPPGPRKIHHNKFRDMEHKIVYTMLGD